jgi:trans-2,3-dihydro-3-hydroxyanthranilate isomerase
MRKAIYYLMDVFTDKPYCGNQLAIFPDASDLPEEVLQTLATELNLSESVFLYPASDESSLKKMRIFTPGQELPTAGHPTVGTAIFLAKELSLQQNEKISIHLEQPIGKIKIDIEVKENHAIWASMYQPLPTFGKIYTNRADFAALIGLALDDLLPYPVQWISCGVPYIIIPVKDLSAVRSIGFRLDKFDELKSSFGNAFIYAFTPDGERLGSDVHGRMFAPEAGILEDPATGSANGPLGCYLRKYDIKQSPFVSEQGFEMGRPSIMYIDIQEDVDKNITQVKVGGQAQFVGKGEIYL